MKITTARLTLKALTQSDWPLFLALHDDPSVINTCFDRPTDAQIRNKFIQRLGPWQANQGAPLCLVIIETKTNQKVGVTGFTSSAKNKHEVGYLLLSEFHAKGYATESLKGVIHMAYEQYSISEFYGVVTQGNKASEHVLKKCGFTHTHTKERAYMLGGRLYDDHHYKLCLEPK